MLHVGQLETFPKLLFVSNRLRIEKLVEKGRRRTRGRGDSSSDNHMVRASNRAQLRVDNDSRSSPTGARSPRTAESDGSASGSAARPPTLETKTSWFGSWSLGTGHANGLSPRSPDTLGVPPGGPGDEQVNREGRRGSALEELSRQSSVLFGFHGSDGTSEDEEEKPLNGDEDEHTGIGSRSDASAPGDNEDGESDNAGEGVVDFVQGGGRALL